MYVYNVKLEKQKRLYRLDKLSAEYIRVLGTFTKNVFL